MKLQDFVTETLVEIATGVRDAQTKVDELGGAVNPYRGSATAVQDIEFDVEVSAAEGTATKGGLGILVGVLSVGTKGQSESSSRSAGRIRFRVPIELPNPPRS